MRLTYHEEAEAELLEAGRFYRTRGPGLEQRFLQAYETAAARILAAPHRWPVVEGDLRRYSLRTFPYAVYYRLLPGDEVRILAVKHHKRHPAYWRHRLDD